MAHKEWGLILKVFVLKEHRAGMQARGGEEALQQLICRRVTPALPFSLEVIPFPPGSCPIYLALELALAY